VQVHKVSTINKIHTGSDHRLVRARVKLNTKMTRNKLAKSNKTTNIDFNSLRKSKKDEYNIELANKFQSPAEILGPTLNTSSVGHGFILSTIGCAHAGGIPTTLHHESVFSL